MNQFENTAITRRERIAARQTEIDALAVELAQCSCDIAASRERRRLLARKYNNKIAFLGFLLDD